MVTYTPIYRKPESECSPITLIMRKYYTAERSMKASEYRNAHKQLINTTLRERYHSDPQYREHVLAQRKANYHARKHKLSAN